MLVSSAYKTEVDYTSHNVLSGKPIKSPLNYIGDKQRLLKQLLPLFPSQIRVFVDLFASGCNVGINANAEQVYLNDNLIYLVDMYKAFQELDIRQILVHIENRIEEYGLSLTNEEGYKLIREHYNQKKNPLDLFVLIAFSFNHQIRFNNSHKFNNPFGKERSAFNSMMKQNLINFITALKTKDIEFFCQSFEEFDFLSLNSSDFVYCDPPYLITTGTYNDGKRGFKGWGENEELDLLATLDSLHKKQIKFALSNVLEHKGRSNDILKDWLQNNADYEISYMNMHYANSSYQTLDRSKNSSVEVLITNYATNKSIITPTLFDGLN